MKLPLDRIALDPELQPRAAMDRATYEDYGHALVDGAALPPVLVVAEGDTYWLADGYHRWHAHKALGLEEIAAEVRPGTRQDALRLSLAANATHGKRREPGDYRRAYGLAVKHGLVEPVDVEGVAALLRCTGRWAEVLTKDARDAARAEREADWRAKSEAGASNRQIAREAGVDETTVRRALGAAETKPSQKPHPDPPPDPVRQAKDAAKAGAEAYFAQAKAAGEAPSMKGLQGAVNAAVEAVLGPPPPRQARRPPAPPPGDGLGDAWITWTAAVEHLATADAELDALAARRPGHLEDLLDEARRAVPRLAEWLAALEATAPPTSAEPARSTPPALRRPGTR